MADPTLAELLEEAAEVIEGVEGIEAALEILAARLRFHAERLRLEARDAETAGREGPMKAALWSARGCLAGVVGYAATNGIPHADASNVLRIVEEALAGRSAPRPPLRDNAALQEGTG